MSNSLKLVIFDVDGTLVDSQHMICAAMHNAFTNHNLPCPPRETLLAIVGLSLPEAFQRLGEGWDGFPAATLIEHYKDAFFALRQSGQYPELLYPGARAAIEQLAVRDDVVLGIATGKSQRGARTVLGRHDLLRHFSTIKTADDAPSKPHPGMVIEAMRETGVEPGDTLVVGDSIYDMEMARAAGVSALGVAWGYHSVPALWQAGAQAVIDDFSALMPALDPMWDAASCGLAAEQA